MVVVRRPGAGGGGPTHDRRESQGKGPGPDSELRAHGHNSVVSDLSDRPRVRDRLQVQLSFISVEK